MGIVAGETDPGPSACGGDLYRPCKTNSDLAPICHMGPTAHAPGRSGEGSGGPYFTFSARSGWQKVRGGPGAQNGAPGAAFRGRNTLQTLLGLVIVRVSSGLTVWACITSRRCACAFYRKHVCVALDSNSYGG